MTINLTEDTFRETLAAEPLPVLVLFTGSFCGPSHLIYPMIDALIENSDGTELTYAEVDVEKCPTITREFQVKATPTLIYFDRGVPLGSRVGSMSQEDLNDFLTDMESRLGKA